MLTAISALNRKPIFRKNNVVLHNQYLQNKQSNIPSTYKIKLQFKKNGDLYSEEEMKQLADINKEKYIVSFFGSLLMFCFFIVILYERQPLRLH